MRGENAWEKDDKHILTGVQGTHYRPCSSLEVELLQTRDGSFTCGRHQLGKGCANECEGS
jgi:hypothetical protein